MKGFAKRDDVRGVRRR
jgi:hypothetical protein